MEASTVLTTSAAKEQEWEHGKRDFRAMMRFFGPIRGLQVLGFCGMWARLNNRPLAEVQKELEDAGLSRSAMYRHLRHLREWHTHLVEKGEEDPGTVEDLARRVASP